jgi:membrane protease YdiL (CAAX protease family)
VRRGVLDERHPGRLAGWLVFVSALAATAYAERLAGGETPKDIAYRYSSSVLALIEYGFILGILLLIARGLPRREVFALRAPTSWRRGLGFALLALLVIYAGAFAYERLLSVFGNWSPTEEQGLVPSGWDSSRAGAFVAFFLAVTILAPTVEELTYRGLGMSLLWPWGVPIAIAVTGVLFGAAHGLLVGLPILTFFGLTQGWLRARTDSIFPPIALHATFNGIALIAAVSGAGN